MYYGSLLWLGTESYCMASIWTLIWPPQRWDLPELKPRRLAPVSTCTDDVCSRFLDIYRLSRESAVVATEFGRHFSWPRQWALRLPGNKWCRTLFSLCELNDLRTRCWNKLVWMEKYDGLDSEPCWDNSVWMKKYPTSWLCGPVPASTRVTLGWWPEFLSLNSLSLGPLNKGFHLRGMGNSHNLIKKQWFITYHHTPSFGP